MSGLEMILGLPFFAGALGLVLAGFEAAQDAVSNFRWQCDVRRGRPHRAQRGGDRELA